MAISAVMQLVFIWPSRLGETDRCQRACSPDGATPLPQLPDRGCGPRRVPVRLRTFRPAARGVLDARVRWGGA